MHTTLPPLLSARTQRIQPSPTLTIGARADRLIADGKPIINLSIGEPDFDTPDFIKEAAIKAIQAGHTKYTAVDGIPELKQAIQDKFERENALIFKPNQIIVSCGAKHSLFNLFMAVLNTGDEVIVPAPYWVSYPDMVQFANATPVIIHTNQKQQFKITASQLEKAITPKTKLFILNSPSNPSGMIYSASELKALADVLLAHPQVLIVTDDIYEHTLWHNLPFKNILNVCADLDQRTIVINGVSKAYAMTGWRIGYAASGNTDIIAAMKKIQSQSTSSPSSISQYAATAALNGDPASSVMMTAAYKARHDFLIKGLQQIKGFSCLPSDGTFYSFPNISALLEDDVAFAEFLLNKAEIAVIPGSAFGTPGHIRLSYATSMANLEQAVERIARALSS